MLDDVMQSVIVSESVPDVAQMKVRGQGLEGMQVKLEWANFSFRLVNDFNKMTGRFVDHDVVRIRGSMEENH